VWRGDSVSGEADAVALAMTITYDRIDRSATVNRPSRARCGPLFEEYKST